MSNNIEQAVMDENKTAKKVKLVRVFSILAFVLSLGGVLFLEAISLISLIGTTFTSVLSSFGSGIVGIILMVVAIIIEFSLFAILVVAELIAFIPCLCGLAFSVVSLILNGKKKDHASTVFGVMAMPFAVFGTLSVIKSLIKILLLIILIIIAVILLAGTLLVLLIVFGL